MTIKEVVAGIIMQRHADGSVRILVCQRSHLDTMPLKWEFPGGKIEIGESPAEALRRELQEELGIEAGIGEIVTSVQHAYATGLAVRLTFFRVENYVGNIQNLIFEDIRWATRSEIESFDWLEADRPVVAAFARGEFV